METGIFSPPLSGLKLSRVKGYGSVELENPSGGGIAIVPLHIGYIQDQAQNHCLCSSAFIAAGQKRMFTDACCVQESQGGYLEGKEQWFFVLPLPLREEALLLRGQKSFGKLWDGITRLNKKLGLAGRGHLEQIISRKKAYLTQYQSRFERLPEQTGAIFFIKDKLAGVEIAPNAEYFEELWAPLVCFCYGAAAMYVETREAQEEEMPQWFSARSLGGLRDELNEKRQGVMENLQSVMEGTPKETFNRQEQERFLDMRLDTVAGRNFAGQIVEEKDRLLYVSIAAKYKYFFDEY